MSNPTPIQPAPEGVRAITPESQPVFPCWAYSYMWFRVPVMGHMLPCYTHWHPDQPTAPTVTPAHGEQQGTSASDIHDPRRVEVVISGAVANAMDIQRKAATEGRNPDCPECKGTGWFHAFTGQEPCFCRPAQGKREAPGTARSHAELMAMKLMAWSVLPVFEGTNSSMVYDDLRAAADELRRLERELTAAKEQWRMSSVCRELTERLGEVERLSEERRAAIQWAKEEYAALQSRALAAEQKVKEVEAKYTGLKWAPRSDSDSFCYVAVPESHLTALRIKLTATEQTLKELTAVTAKNIYDGLNQDAQKQLVELRKEKARLSLLEWLGESAFFPDWDDNGFWHAKVNGQRVIGTTLRQFCDAAIETRVATQEPLQADDPENPWRTMDRAPKDATWVDVKVEKTQKVYRAHWAQDLSGEDQPPFRGWFIKTGPTSNVQIADPYAWRPVRETTTGGVKP